MASTPPQSASSSCRSPSTRQPLSTIISASRRWAILKAAWATIGRLPALPARAGPGAGVARELDAYGAAREAGLVPPATGAPRRGTACG
jgi:hypothetical protein